MTESGDIVRQGKLSRERKKERSWGYRRGKRRRWKELRRRHPLLGGLISVAFAAFLLWFSNQKYWLSTPPGLKPVKRVSLVDWIQSRVYARRAIVQEAKGELGEALQSWKLALANRPGSWGLNRQLLDLIERLPPGPETARDLMIFGPRLLWLSSDNVSDLLRVARAYEACRLYEAIGTLLGNRLEWLPLEAKFAYARALFHLEQYEGFQRFWDQMEENKDESTLMDVYRLATSAILEGGGPSLGELRRAYNSFAPQSADYLRSRQVALVVHCALGQRGVGQSLLAELDRQEAASLLDYLVYWEMLLRLGVPEAILCDDDALAQPTCGRESMALARVLGRAGYEFLALSAATQGVEWFGATEPEPWLVLGDQLIGRTDWPALVALGERMAGGTQSFETQAITLYWKAAMADGQLDRQQVALYCRDLSSVPPETAFLRLELAKRVVALGEVGAADSLVLSLPGTRDDVRQYWLARCDHALGTGDFGDFERAARAAFESDGGFVPHVMNYLRALLRGRGSEEMALLLCERLRVSGGDDLEPVVERVSGLVRARAWGEALGVMDSMD